MMLYYIDDSMFQNSAFAKEVRYRFERLIQNDHADMILISAANQDNANLKNFIDTYKNIPIVLSPALFDVNGVRGNLHTTYLSLEGFPAAKTYSGSCIVFDETAHSCRRVYLDLFWKHHQDEFLEMLSDALEKVFMENLNDQKKKKLTH